jgi:hypothetical protein
VFVKVTTSVTPEWLEVGIGGFPAEDLEACLKDMGFDASWSLEIDDVWVFSADIAIF